MTIVHEFEYIKPKTLAEALEILARHGDRARVLAGGTDLVPWLREEVLTPDLLVDIKDIEDLQGIDWAEGTLLIGALVTFRELIDSAIIREKFPLIAEMARKVASPGIRNRATLTGNICSAVPSCDSGPVLLVYRAEVRVRGPGGERMIPIKEWFLGPKQNALKEGEMVTGLLVPLPGSSHGGCYVKLGRYRGEDLAQASVAVLALVEYKYRIAFGAVAPTPLRVPRIEALLEGKQLNEAIISQAQELVAEEIAPITDIRATEEYRRLMVRVMLDRGLRAAASRLSGKGPPYGTNLI